MDQSTSKPLDPNSCSSSNGIQIDDVETCNLTGYSQSDLNKVGQYLSKHKMVLLEKSNFSLQQVFELLENQSVYKNIESVIENLDSGSDIPVEHNSHSSSQSAPAGVQTSTETHFAHGSEVDRGLPSVEDNPNPNISPDPCPPVSNPEDVYSDTTPVSDSSQSFISEMFLLFFS